VNVAMDATAGTFSPLLLSIVYADLTCDAIKTELRLVIRGTDYADRKMLVD